MKNISKLLKGLLVGALIINAPVNEAEAFFLMPPMPWDVELDIPANANKIVANMQTLYRQYQTYYSELNTNKLEAIKKATGVQFGNLKNKTLSSEGKGKAKTPMKKETKANGELGIEENDLNEEHYFNAYYRLFFTYPQMEGTGQGQIELSADAKADYPVLQTAYKHMTTKYRQDVIVDAYLTGRLTEDYLAVVDKTLQRLDMCLNQDWSTAGLNEKKCTFFGLHMVEVKNNNEAPSDPEGDNSGQLGAAMNAYVVTTVYDRLLRIVEDLTATEAIYRAAKQLDMADPIMTGQQSSAEKYLPNTYQFAYNEIYDHYHAKSLLNSYNRTNACKNGGDDCPDKNKDKTEIANIDNTDILGKLQPIDEMLNKAVQLHNLKNQMPEYKAQFRKYKKAKEIHARLLKAVEQSDQCVQAFLNRHGRGIAWGASSPANDYESRSGISYELIKAYEKAINETIIGTTAECEGYYSTQNSCPEGYVWDTTEYCHYEDKNGKIVSNPSLHPCVLETVAYDTEGSENNSGIPTDYEEAGGNLLQKISSGNDSYDDADYLIESGNADKIDLENRKKAEQAWRIGYNKVMELTENGSLKFDPWNDQQNLQQEYLHNKYRNMRIIIKSVDQGVKSYQIASAIAKATAYTNQEPIEDLVRNVTECASLEKARVEAYKIYCADYPKYTTKFVTNDDGVTSEKGYELTCKVTKNDQTGSITGVREVKINGEIQTQTKEWMQVVSANKSCPFKGTRQRNLPKVTNQTHKCAGNWNFTVKDLVKNYFPAVLGGCSENPEERVYNEAKKHGRDVAMDYFNDVLEAQHAGEQELVAFIKSYDDDLKENKEKLQSTKDSIKMYNQQIDKATKEKNRLLKEIKRTKQRTLDITKEQAEVQQRLKSDLITKKDVCALKIRQTLLENESGCINEENYKINTTCPSECSEKAETREKQCQQLNTFKCKTYVRDVLYVEENKSKTPELTFVIPSLAEKKIAELKPEIDSAKAARDEIKEKVKSLENDIKAKAEEFAKQYLIKAEAMQEVVEARNKTFEDFLETTDGTSQSKRMKDTKHQKCCGPLGMCTKHCPVKFTTDNLETTLAKITYHGAGDLETAIKYGSSENRESLNGIWFENMDISSLASNLQSVGVPASFVTDGTVLGLAKGPQTAVKMAESIVNGDTKKLVLDLAGKEIANYIQKADKIIKEEVDKAVDKVNATAESLGVLDTSKISEEQANYLSKSENYTDIANKHNTLIEDIKEPTAANASTLRRAKVDLSEIFGIPDTIKNDEEYFVGLPARGNNYIGIDPKEDENAGRDYFSPKGPLLNLPPVREVFYYSALDYDDTPKEKNRPAIPYLLNFKYPDGEKLEYLPEIWRYLLASPNLRSDGKYQRTFVERSLNTSDLKKLLEAPAGESSKNYRTIIGRGGIYPCKIKDHQYIDIEGTNDKATGLTYKLRSSMPQGVAAAPNCQEVAFNNTYGTNSCYAYNKDKSGICHLMADHGKRPDVNDIQTSLSQTNKGIFDNYSELGQFIDGNLKYRSLQENILAYQIDSKNNQNDITRQKADTATFKRNVMGSFLETVKMEHGAKENLDKIENDMKNMLISLCEQLHEADWTISNNKNETAETCATYIMNHGGLAENGEDTKYGETEEYGKHYSNFEGIKCPSSKTLYENIFCNLKDLKEEALTKAIKGYSYKDQETGEKVTVEGFEKVKEQDDSRIQERIDNIEKYINMLTKDNQEILLLTPSITEDQLTPQKIAGEKNNRALARIAEDEGIKSMDNQSQSVAYCPIY